MVNPGGVWGQDSWQPLHSSSLHNSKVLLLQKYRHGNWLSFHSCSDSFRQNFVLLSTVKNPIISAALHIEVVIWGGKSSCFAYRGWKIKLLCRSYECITFCVIWYCQHNALFHTADIKNILCIFWYLKQQCLILYSSGTITNYNTSTILI
jgi:hypothetical protein